MTAARETDTLFRREALEQRARAGLGDVSIATPPSTWILLALIAAFAITLLLALASGSYAQRASASGWISTDAGIVRVRSPESGVVSRVHAVQGATVRKGDALFAVDLESDDGDGKGVSGQAVEQLDIELEQIEARLRATQQAAALALDDLDQRSRSLVADQQRMERQIALQADRLVVAAARLEQIEAVADKGFVARTELLRSRDDALSRRQEMETLQRQRETVAASIQQLARDRERLPVQNEQAVASLLEQGAALRRQRALARRSVRFTVRSPVDGVLSAVMAEPGKRTDPTREEVTLVPSGARLQAILFAPSSAAGMIASGQDVRLRFDSFPHAQYGIGRGTVESIARTSVAPAAVDLPLPGPEPVFRVTVALATPWVEAQGRQIPLQPGMTLHADIVLTRRPLWRALLDPLVAAGSR